MEGNAYLMMEMAIKEILPRFASAVERWRRYLDTDDLAQAARLRLWMHLSKNGETVPSRKLCRTIVMNAMFDEIRRARKWSSYEVPADEASSEEEEDGDGEEY